MSKEKDWFSTVAGRRITVVEISKLLDMNRNTATTRMQDGLSSDEIITLARRLHINPVMALEELGKVTIKEIFDYVDSDGTLVATASTDQLIFHLADTSLSLGQKRELLKRVSPQLERSDELAERRANRVVADPTYNPSHLLQTAAQTKINCEGSTTMTTTFPDLAVMAEVLGVTLTHHTVPKRLL